MNKYIITSCLLLALAVILGAFGAHAWKDILVGHESTFETGHQYHLAMTLGVLALAALARKNAGRWLKAGMFLILLGTLCFSGSLYMLSFPEVFSGIARSILGPTTPIGGLLMITGWLISAYSFYIIN